MEVIRSDKFVGDLEEADRLLKLEGIMCGDDLELYSHQVDIDYAVLNKNRNWIKNSKREQYYHSGITCRKRHLILELRDSTVIAEIYVRSGKLVRIIF